MEKNTKNTTNNNRDVHVIDVSYILKAIWRKAWLVTLVTILAGGILLGCTVLFITPKYDASVIMYVNDNSISIGDTLSLSQLDAARDRVSSYLVILNTRTTLEEVIQKAGVDYTYEELKDMITAGPVDETEFFKITVTSTDPYEAAAIANVIDDILAERTEEIIEGTKVRTADHAIVDNRKVSPSITKNTILGMLLGFVVCCAIVATFAVLDETIRDEEYILQTYDLPVLAKIPDLLSDDGGKKYSSYYSYGSDRDKK